MTIRLELFEYLDYFGRTVPVRDLAQQDDVANVIALRHDIDHSLDLALELAHYEHQRGIRATYYLLHTHSYWQDPDLVLKCRQLQEYGHEVGLHLNVLTQWINGSCNDIDAAIADVLTPLHEAGVVITSTSAHGDRACYEHGFSNYWIWQELRGDDPIAAQHSRSAEGIAVDEERWQITYPADHVLHRADGEQLQLWQSSLAAHGLECDAIHVPIDHYWTDTGGKWSRTGDPMAHDLSAGRHQVLIHPWWWRGQQKRYFFLSAARSGTAWLSNFIDRATSCAGVHEFTFNHRYDNDELVADKRTTDDFDTLCNDKSTAINLIRHSLRWMRQQSGDIAEANVYLEPFLTELRELASDAVLVHVHRDGRDVVRSILDRGWYASPQDHKHRAMPVAHWNRLTQFERACWYWQYTNESIMPHTSARLRFENMVTDKAYLSRQLEQLGIVVHPLLAEKVFDTPMNQSRESVFGSYDLWPTAYKETFDRICDLLRSTLGYGSARRAASARTQHEPTPAQDSLNESHIVLDLEMSNGPEPAVSPKNVEVAFTAAGLSVWASDSSAEVKNRVLMLCEGAWSKVHAESGVACRPDVYYTCSIASRVDKDVRVRLFVLFYDSNETLVRKLQVATLRSDTPQRRVSFSPAMGASHFALALHLGTAQPSQTVVLERVRVEAHTMDRRYTARPEAGPGTTLNRPSAVTG